MQRKTTCCFTGHRELLQDEKALQKELEKSICSLIEAGFITFQSGGALGFDTLAAQTVLNLKKLFPHIRLSLVLPCRDQDRFWSKPQQETLRDLIENADETVYTSNRYHKGCMYRRNRFLVDSASCVLAYLEKAQGGTKYTVDYAKKSGVDILFLNGNSSPVQLSFLN